MTTAVTFSFRRLAVVVGVVVLVACLAADRPQSLPPWALVALATASAGVWTLATLLPDRLVAARATGFTLYGVAGGALDLVQPWGPGFVGGFMAVAALALLLPLRPAIALALPVLGVVGAAETLTSEYPWSALLNIALGLGFFFAAARFAAVNREASSRTAQLLEQESALRAARDEAAALGERTRLARELHDVLAHTLSGLSLQLEAARLLAVRAGADARVLEQLELAQRSAKSGVVDGKRAIAALRGHPLAGIADLDDLVETFRRDTGIPADLVMHGEPRPLPAEHGLAVFRTVQESLSNVRRHAPDAKAVHIDVAWGDSGVVVTVTDTGASEDAGIPSGPGFGLAGLAERAAALGGEFEAGRAGDGHRTRLALPVAPAGDEG